MGATRFPGCAEPAFPMGIRNTNGYYSNLARRRRRALLTTETELRLMAAPAFASLSETRLFLYLSICYTHKTLNLT
jgi:hypothetical protein